MQKTIPRRDCSVCRQLSMKMRAGSRTDSMRIAASFTLRRSQSLYFYFLVIKTSAAIRTASSRVKTCRTNPYCIHRLGLEKWEQLRKKQLENPVPDAVRRNLQSQPCGLENFGNFCYVNSFLQVCKFFCPYYKLYRRKFVVADLV